MHCWIVYFELAQPLFVELKHCGYNHNYQAKSKTKRLLDIPFLKNKFMAHNLLNASASKTRTI